jgi:hypothetical protein
VEGALTHPLKGIWADVGADLAQQSSDCPLASADTVATARPSRTPMKRRCTIRMGRVSGGPGLGPGGRCRGIQHRAEVAQVRRARCLQERPRPQRQMPSVPELRPKVQCIPSTQLTDPWGYSETLSPGEQMCTLTRRLPMISRGLCALGQRPLYRESFRILQRSRGTRQMGRCPLTSIPDPRHWAEGSLRILLNTIFQATACTHRCYGESFVCLRPCSHPRTI